ncbi:MAG: class I SAM-dependent methyltransferase [Terracidiphilus sp.]|nr:class I SAM-dependent methyltransferase [Terracidiphilus sp.]
MNPWLEVPLADYEAHMTSAAVGQAAALSELFRQVLHQRKPASVAILGIAGGNGLEHIDPSSTRRVVGIDLNPAYVNATRERYPHLPGLELLTADLSNKSIAMEPVSLVHAALVFEHAGISQCLDNALALVSPTGALSVVLQLPSSSAGTIGNSGVSSVAKFAGHFSLIDVDEFTAILTSRGLKLVHEKLHPVPAGKQLWLGVFERS